MSERRERGRGRVFARQEDDSVGMIGWIVAIDVSAHTHSGGSDDRCQRSTTNYEVCTDWRGERERERGERSY